MVLEARFCPAYLGDEITFLTGLIFLWPSLAIDIKRWHDLGMSGWTVLVVYLPAVVLHGLVFASVGGTTDHPDQKVAAFLYLFGLVALVYFIILAARKGMAGTKSIRGASRVRGQLFRTSRRVGNACGASLIVCKMPCFWNFPANHTFSMKKATNFFSWIAWFYNTSLKTIWLAALTDRSNNRASQPISVRRPS